MVVNIPLHPRGTNAALAAAHTQSQNQPALLQRAGSVSSSIHSLRICSPGDKLKDPLTC